MFAILLATLYMIEPLLDTMGLRGCLFCGFGVSYRIWGWMHKWGKVFVSVLGDLSLGFAVFEYIDFCIWGLGP